MLFELSCDLLYNNINDKLNDQKLKNKKMHLNKMKYIIIKLEFMQNNKS